MASCAGSSSDPIPSHAGNSSGPVNIHVKASTLAERKYATELHEVSQNALKRKELRKQLKWDDTASYGLQLCNFPSEFVDFYKMRYWTMKSLQNNLEWSRDKFIEDFHARLPRLPQQVNGVRKGEPKWTNGNTMYCIKLLEPIFKAIETRETSSVQPSAVGAEDGSPCFDLASSSRLSAIAEEASSYVQSSAVAAEDGSLCFDFAPT